MFSFAPPGPAPQLLLLVSVCLAVFFLTPSPSPEAIGGCTYPLAGNDTTSGPLGHSPPWSSPAVRLLIRTTPRAALPVSCCLTARTCERRGRWPIYARPILGSASRPVCRRWPVLRNSRPRCECDSQECTPYHDRR